MANVLKQSLSRLVFNDNIGHILGDEVVHVLSPELVDAGVIEVAIIVLWRVGLLNALVMQHLLREVLVQQLVPVLGLGGPIACLVAPVLVAPSASLLGCFLLLLLGLVAPIFLVYVLLRLNVIFFLS